MTTIEQLDPSVPLFARTGINLASAGLGAKALHSTNDFFAPVERMRATARCTTGGVSSRQ